MAVLIDPERIKVLRVAPRLMQILRVLARHALEAAERLIIEADKRKRDTFKDDAKASVVLELHGVFAP